MRAFDDVRSAHWTANLEVTNYSQSRRVVSLYPSMACSWKINLVPSLSCNAVRRFIVTHSNLHIRINWTSTVNIRKFRAFVHSLCNNIIKVSEWFIDDWDIIQIKFNFQNPKSGPPRFRIPRDYRGFPLCAYYQLHLSTIRKEHTILRSSTWYRVWSGLSLCPGVCMHTDILDKFFLSRYPSVLANR